MGCTSSSNKLPEKLAFKLFSYDPDIVIFIRPMPSGYRVISSGNDVSNVIFYENIKKITFDGIHHKNNEHYKKYTLIYKKLSNDYVSININIPIDDINKKSEINMDAKKIVKLIVDDYKVFLVKNNMKCKNYIF
jgi:hypothetical protein